VIDPGWLPEFAKVLAPILIEHGVARIKRAKDSKAKVLERALSVALMHLRQQYADVEASLFDEYFVRQTAAPLFSRYFGGSGWPKADDVAATWVQNLGPNVHDIDTSRVQEGARAFLSYLEAELMAHEEFNHLFKNRVASDVAAIRAIEQSKSLALIPVRDLKGIMFELGGDLAADFHFVREPVQTVWDEARSCLERAASGKGTHGLLALGTANSGKSRLILEVLRTTLLNWKTLAWRPDYRIDMIPGAEALEGCNLVLFLDDLQAYCAPPSMSLGDLTVAPTAGAATTVTTVLQRLRNASRRVVIVATCRSEGADDVLASLPSLYQELTPITLPTFSPDPTEDEARAVIESFSAAGASHVDEWDGTLGSLVLGLGDKRSQYLAHREQLPALILRAMKLLATTMTHAHTVERLRATCIGIFGVPEFPAHAAPWRSAIRTLVNEQFVTEELSAEVGARELRIRKDSYFEQVITNYPGSSAQLDDDLTALRVVFRELGDVQALSNLGVALSTRRGYEIALEVYNEALAIDPAYVNALQNKANALYELGLFSDAIQVSDEVFRQEGLTAAMWSNRGVLLEALGRREEALGAFDRALSLDPQLALAAINKGTLLSIAKRNTEALDIFLKALLIEPENEVLLVNLGVVYHRLHMLTQAREIFEKVLLLHPGAKNVKVNLAGVVAFLGDTERGLDLLSEISDEDTMAFQAWHNRGSIYAQQQRREEAMQAYDHALALNPRHALTIACIAGVYNQLELHTKAIELCQRAIEIDPGCPDAWRNMGAAYCGVNLFELAKEPLEMALLLDSQDAHAWYFKGVTWLNLKQIDVAIQALDRSLELDASHAEAHKARHHIREQFGK
jgi:tetratricopeptide (TPR) repeat protein